MLFRSPDGPGGHVFAIPRIGHEELVAIHDSLYRGRLTRHLDSTRPFVPHVTVAATSSWAECQLLAEEFGRLGLEIEGAVRALEVIEVDETIRTLATVQLR